MTLSGLFLCFAGAPLVAQPTVSSFAEFEKISAVRVSRTVAEFTYRIRLTAGSEDLAGAVVEVTSSGAHTAIVDSQASFGAMGAGVAAFSLDTFSFHHDRQYPFDPSVLSYTVDATPANRPPIANAGPDQTAFVSDRVTLDGSASADIDGDLLSFSWTLTSAPAGSGAFVSDSSAVMPTSDLDRPGSYVLSLVVNDGQVDSLPDTVVVDTRNSPPVANAGDDQTVFVGTEVSLDGSGSTDVDGDLLTFSWVLSNVPPGSTAVLSDADTVMPKFLVDVPGNYSITLVVHDGSVPSAPDTVLGGHAKLAAGSGCRSRSDRFCHRSCEP